jgi:8-oxo-dGTP diphosphatase
VSAAGLPYKVAVLCYLRDAAGRVLLLHRRKPPNPGMYSPIGGKLETAAGEGPHACALREIREEVGIALEAEEIRLCGIVSESGYEGHAHWLIFLFEVVRPIDPAEIAAMEFDEGRLEWVEASQVESLPIPATDREVMWPAVEAHRGGFFMVHIDCEADGFRWHLHESEVADASPADGG